MNLPRLHTEFKVQQGVLEHMINGTPTSERRNLLTEANIHFMLGMQKLAEAEKLPYSTNNYGAGDNVADKGASSHGNG